MASSRPSLRLFHASESFCEVIILGNKALSNGNFEEAIYHYTEVLYKLSTAHVYALLNRSLAYLFAGYYELAVTDAYRAWWAASEMRSNNPVADSRLNKAAKYVRAEQLHISANDEWTRPGRRNVGTGWATSPLASIVANVSPEFAVPTGPEGPPSGRSKVEFVRALETRATYRLCGALFMVGGGARYDALGLIDDAKARIKMDSCVSRWFDDLGNEIINQLVSEVDPSDPRGLELLGHDTKEKRDERMVRLKQSMKATTTDVRYGDYPWNQFEPKLGEPRWQTQVQTWVEFYSSNCSAHVVRPEETERIHVEAPKPYVELRANRDINTGDLVLSQHTVSNVTTSIPEQIEANGRGGTFDQYYCNSCASLLVVPRECLNSFMKPQTRVELQDSPAISTSSSLIPSSQNSANIPVDNRNTGASIATQFEQRPNTHVASSLLARSSPRQDFMFCSPDHMVPTCSAACRTMSEDFDEGMCHSKLEQRLRESRLNDPMPRPTTACKTRCLRDLIFLRHITMAINFDTHPLNLHDLMFSSSGPNIRDIESSEVEPWSFTSHVVRPLRDLQQLFKNTDTDQFDKLSQLDGWVLNTLLIKINRVMRISKGPRFVKCFRADGLLNTAFVPSDERWEGLTELPKEQVDTSIWIAGIDSLFNLIRIADPALGETPNVAVIQREGVNVYVVGTGSEPAIKAGESLLRAADDAEGPVLDKSLYAYDSRSRMQATNEQQEVEATHSGDTSEFLDEGSI